MNWILSLLSALGPVGGRLGGSRFRFPQRDRLDQIVRILEKDFQSQREIARRRLVESPVAWVALFDPMTGGSLLKLLQDLLLNPETLREILAQEDPGSQFLKRFLFGEKRSGSGIPADILLG